MSLEGARKAPVTQCSHKTCSLCPSLGRTALLSVLCLCLLCETGILTYVNKESVGSRALSPVLWPPGAEHFVCGTLGVTGCMGHIISTHHSQCFQVPSSLKARSKEPATEHTASGPEACSCKNRNVSCGQTLLYPWHRLAQFPL